MEVTRIQSALSQLSNEAIQAAVVRVDEGGFDKNRGIVPLDRSVEDLQIARDLLLVFASEGRAERVPVLIRQAVGEPLEVIASCITDLSNGADRVPDFVQAVDRLRAAIWQYHLDQPGSDYLKLQDRLGELGGLIAEAKSLRKEVDARLQQLRDLETVRQNSDQAFQQTAGFATQAQEGFTLVQDRLQQIESLLTTSKNYEGQISTVSAAVGTIRDTVITMSEDLTSIYDEGHKFKETISETSRRAESTIAEASQRAETIIVANGQKTDELLRTLAQLETRIKDALSNATGVSLFHSFQERSEQLKKGKWIWAKLLAGAVFAAVALAAFIGWSGVPLSTALYLKLAVAVPIGLGGWFCTAQYSRERRLEEEYAFKANISVSLTAYKNLVEEVLPERDGVALAKYADFIIDSVGKVYTSPSGFGGKDADLPLDKAETVLKSALDIIKQALEVLGRK